MVLSLFAGACLFLCCGGLGVIAMFGMEVEDAAGERLAEGDALWDTGDKPGAVGKYRDILDGHRVRSASRKRTGLASTAHDRLRVQGRSWRCRQEAH